MVLTFKLSISRLVTVKAKNTKTQILDAAQELIQTFGVNGMSYRNIADVVKIRTASIHYHFPTKEDLVQNLISRYQARFLSEVDEILNSKQSASEKLNRYADLFIQTLKSGKQGKVCLCGMLGAELSTLGSPLVNDIAEFYSENASRLAKVLDEGHQAGEFMFSGNSLVLAHTIFSLLEGSMLIVRAEGGVDRFREIWMTFNNLLK